MNFFTASDGKEYELDTWYPLPFLVPFRVGRYAKLNRPDVFSSFPGVPTTGAGNRLLRKFTDGTIEVWGPFTTLARMDAEKVNLPTHWMVQSWSDYVI